MKTASKRRATRAVTDGDTILATSEVAAPPEVVFRALTTEELERWWGSAETYRLTAWTADLRVGGRWQVTVRDASGKLVPVGGKFLEIDAPRKLVQTWNPTWESSAPTRVTYLLSEIPGGTRVTVRHEGFGDHADACLGHTDGWEHVLNCLSGWVLR